MISQRLSRLALVGGFAALVGWLAFGESNRGTARQLPALPAGEAVPVTRITAAQDKGRATDKAGVTKAIEAFEAAFSKGDGKALAALWAADGEYISDDGTTFTGRAALEKAYVEFFSKNPDNAMNVEVETIKFPSRETAVVEGHFKLKRGKKQELVVSKCSFLYAREDGQWLIAIAREWPGDGLTLRDLEWLIGTWEAKKDGMAVSTKYAWTANKSFIRCDFTLTHEGKTHTGMQMIGKDPSTGLLHVWTFEDSGGIGNTTITRDDKKWVHSATAVTVDGRVLTSTNIMTPIDHDSFIWQAVERTLDDEELPDLPPIKVVRVKGK